MSVDDLRAAWKRQRESKTRPKPQPAPSPSKGGRPRGSKNGKGSSSRYHYVYWCRTSKRWKAMVRFEGRYRHAGSFRVEEDAARAADALSRELFGEAAVLNFPLES